MKTVFLNGAWVAENEANVSVLDRGFLYGDALFETLRVYGGVPFLWKQHWERLGRGAEFLKIKIPLSEDQLRQAAVELIEVNRMPESVLRIQLSRGTGTRGYSIRGACSPGIVMTLHPAPSNAPVTWKLATASLQLPARDPLARFKTGNKLRQVIARTQAEEQGADDALFLNSDDCVAETTSCNLFWVRNGAVFTPPPESGILPGITRAFVFELCRELSIRCEEKNIGRADIERADGIFLTSSVMELVGVERLDERPIARSPVASRLHAAYQEHVKKEARSSTPRL